MRVTSLKLANVRAIETAEFRFQPGFNLIVGVNGVGKSTVLDVLRICMSRILPSTIESRAKTMSFAIGDIRSGHPFLDAELSLTIGVDKFRFTRRQWREAFAADDLAWNPADPAHRIETRVRYELDGSIRADDADFDGQLNDVLNLNLPVLKNNRKGIYDAVLQWWKSQKKRSHGRVLRERLERKLARHDAGVEELAPYGQVAVWLLGQKLAGMAA